MTRTRGIVNAVVFAVLAGTVAGGGVSSDFADGGARSWTGGGCPELAAPSFIPAAVRVVPAHYVSEQLVLSLDEAAALNGDDVEANDVCVLEHLR